MLPGARMEPAWGQAALGRSGMQRGQSTLEWVIGAAVILGTIATQRDPPSNHRARIEIRNWLSGSWRYLCVPGLLPDVVNATVDDGALSISASHGDTMQGDGK
jgi:hypothetical protein